MSTPLVQAKKLKAEDLQRVVKFYAKDCPHSQALDPIWKAAERDWKAAKHDAKLTWQQKECYTTGWKKGKDFKECEQEGVESFPTIKYFYGRSAWSPSILLGSRGKKDQLGEEILEHGDKAPLLKWPGGASIQGQAPGLCGEPGGPTGLGQEDSGLRPHSGAGGCRTCGALASIPIKMGVIEIIAIADRSSHNLDMSGLSGSWGDGQYMQPPPRYGGGKVVDYFAQECVHCQHLKPAACFYAKRLQEAVEVWKNAKRMWDEEHPGADYLQWEEKECFGPRWEPGKDYGECQAQGIHSHLTAGLAPLGSI